MIPEGRRRVHVPEALLRPRGSLRAERVHHLLQRRPAEALLDPRGEVEEVGEGGLAVHRGGPGGEEQLLGRFVVVEGGVGWVGLFE